MSEKRSSTPNVDRFLARTPIEKMLSGAHVPPHFWGADAAKVKYKGGSFRGTKMSATGTKNWIRANVQEPPRRQPFIAVASSPTDNGALYLAYSTLIQYCDVHGARVAIIDSGAPLVYMGGPRLVVIHNILSKPTPERAQTVRDLLIQFRTSLRILAVPAVKDPETWVVSKLGLYPDFVATVGDMTKNDMVGE